MNGLAIEGFRASQLVQFGQAAEGKVMRQNTGHDDRNGRTPRNIDDRFVLDDVGYGNCARGIRVGFWNPAKGSTGTHRDDRRRAFGDLFQGVEVGSATNRRVSPVHPKRNRAVNDKQILSEIVLDRLPQRLFGLMSGSGHQAFPGNRAKSR